MPGKQIRAFKGHAEFVESLAITPDGKCFLSDSRDNTIKVWDIGTGEEIKTFKGHNSWITSLAITPDGKSLFSG
ncbi:unnamed protein product, partial [marine sediment metagenome]